MKDFDIFDSFLDAVFVTDSSGLIKYANLAAAHIADSSTLRLEDKQTLTEALSFTPPLKIKGAHGNYQEYSIKSKKGTSGSVNLISREIKTAKNKLHLFVLRDISLEKTLQEKFQRELQEKNRKIFHMESLVEFNQTTKLLSDTNQLINEFIKFVIAKFQFGGGFFLKKGYGTRVPQIDFITGYAERKIIHSKITMIQAALSKVDIQQIPTELHVHHRPGKEWQNLLEVFTDESFNKKILTARIRVGDEMAITAFTDLDQNRKFDGDDLNLIRTLAQNTEVMIENAELKLLAITDEMTKLYNKRYLTMSFRHELQRSLENSDPLSVLVFDIDHFKKFNDTHGHLAGDLVLKEVAHKVKDLCRLTDIPFRYGGEEFVVLLPATSRPNAAIVAERIRKGVESLSISYEGKPLQVTVSVGVSTCPDDGKEGELLIKCADTALYEAKHAGRNNVKVYVHLKKAS